MRKKELSNLHILCPTPLIRERKNITKGSCHFANENTIFGERGGGEGNGAAQTFVQVNLKIPHRSIS